MKRRSYTYFLAYFVSFGGGCALQTIRSDIRGRIKPPKLKSLPSHISILAPGAKEEVDREGRQNEMKPQMSEYGPNKSLRQVKSKSKSEDAIEPVPKTLPEALRVFFLSSHGVGPSLILVILGTLLSWRLSSLGPIHATDVLACLLSVVFWVFQEHFLHSKVLHCPVEWYGTKIHEEHHDAPYFHVSIDPAPLMLAWMGVAFGIFSCILPFPIACSATLGYASAGLFYEWAHFIVHTKVKPRSKFMKKMRDNHIRHHCVDHRYWFAFSLPWVDDFFSTNPDIQDVRKRKRSEALKSAVPVSLH